MQHSPVEYAHAVGKEFYFQHVMGRKQHGHAFLAKLAYHTAHFEPINNVESRSRLVHYGKLRPHHHCPGYKQLPGHALAVGFYFFLQFVFKARNFPGKFYRLFLPGCIVSIYRSHKFQIPLSCKVFVSAGLFGQITNECAYRFRILNHVVAIYARRTAAGHKQGGQHF